MWSHRGTRSIPRGPEQPGDTWPQFVVLLGWVHAHSEEGAYLLQRVHLGHHLTDVGVHLHQVHAVERSLQ